jgi:hypothetical protein
VVEAVAHQKQEILMVLVMAEMEDLHRFQVLQ